jgi:hypothetical protein
MFGLLRDQDESPRRHCFMFLRVGQRGYIYITVAGTPFHKDWKMVCCATGCSYPQLRSGGAHVRDWGSDGILAKPTALLIGRTLNTITHWEEATRTSRQHEW